MRLTDEPFSAAKGVKSPLTEEKIVEWLVEKKVLSIALQGELNYPPSLTPSSLPPALSLSQEIYTTLSIVTNYGLL